ncbi:MAG: hypothetical protein KatS3mg027_1145 [Bacteroidia bacterium]|nr:MAG: hypothetical protein KatS3mg027_1145 [Bacteroidia bacterium]
MRIDFYIAGIQKAGTTNLAYLLSNSTNIVTHPQLECTFFYDNREYHKGNDYLKKTYFFNTIFKDEQYTLIKHSNSFSKPEILRRVLKHSPQAQIILVFRNPIQRFVSSYLMEKTRSLYPLELKDSVSKALNDKNSFEHKVFYSFGLYDEWLTKIFQTVSDKNIHLFLFEELYNDVEHHLEMFCSKYHITIDINKLKNLPIQNSQKLIKNHWYQKLYLHFRNSKLKNFIKPFIPIKHWVELSKKIEHFNYIEPENKYIIDSEIENILKDAYLKFHKKI